MRGVVFDLDDTLYLERDYVESGFRSVAAALGVEGKPGPEEIFGTLWSGFVAGIRANAFDRLFEHYPTLAQRGSIDSAVSLYRSHDPRISLCGGIPELLASLKGSGARLGLITDGSVTTQQHKIAALKIGYLFDSKIITDEWGVEYRKPNPRAFLHTMSELHLGAEQLVYIGDNPRKDFLAPRELGWRSVRVRMDGQLHCAAEPAARDHSADVEVHSIAELTSLVSAWRGPQAPGGVEENRGPGIAPRPAH